MGTTAKTTSVSKSHAKEEEHEMFPKIKQSSLDLVELGARMGERFQSLRVARH